MRFSKEVAACPDDRLVDVGARLCRLQASALEASSALGDPERKRLSELLRAVDDRRPLQALGLIVEGDERARLALEELAEGVFSSLLHDGEDEHQARGRVIAALA